MKLHIICLLAAVSSALVFTGCGKDDTSSHDFTNKVFVEASSKPVTTYLRKGAPTEFSKTISARIADPATGDIELSYAVEKSLVATYNAAFYDQAEMLPEGYFELPVLKAKIVRGAVVASQITVNFKQLGELDTEKTYVLPVTLASATNIEMLERSRTTYYVFRGAALINIVASLTDNYLDVPWKKPSVVNNLSKVTFEALVNIKKFDHGISTVMGIEENFLLRIGDSGRDANMVQLSTPGGNLPATQNNKLNIPSGEWVHIAATYDATNGGAAQIFINGVLMISGKINDGASINLGSSSPANPGGTEDPRGFHIGYSYDKQRSLNGDIAEVRIWNRILSADEIAEKDHFYYVDPASEGLVTYWKFDDAEGAAVKDYTANGNNAKAPKSLVWNSVELPARAK